jgi:hypothetical protein
MIPTLNIRAFIAPCLLVAASFVQAQGPAFIQGDLLVMVRPDGDVEQVVNDLRVLEGKPTGLSVEQLVSAPMRTWLLHYGNEAIPQPVMLRAIRSHHAVVIAQNNHVVKDRAIPNDALYAQQWHHQNIASEAAWDITTGGVTATGDTIVVCIIENADLPHADLIGNAWYNIHEVAGNSVDDDNNGYVDDVRGWSPQNNNDNVYGGGHGTQVAGMIGAKGNNGSAVAGANWDVKMMVVTRQGVSEAAVVASYTYPLVLRRAYNESNGALGAFVVATNASWGIDNGQPDDSPIWCAMYDTLGAAGVLNCGATANNNVDVDVVGDLPTACASDFMISVTATNIDDDRTFSGYGLTTIDVGAPGADVFTTSIGGGTGSTSGTSFASPLTAGVIGLLYSAPCSSLMDLVQDDPMQGALYVRQALFNGVDQAGNLPGQTVTGGRINSFNSLQWIMSNCGACPAPVGVQSAVTALGEATVSWNSTASDVFNLRYRPVGTTDWTVVGSITDYAYTITSLPYCAEYEFQLEADCDTTTSEFGASFFFISEGCCAAPAILTASTIDSSSATISWDDVLVASNYVLRYAVQGTGAWTEVPGLPDNSTTLIGLQGCTVYEVQMRSTCVGSLSDWGPSTVITTPGCGQCQDGNYCPSVSADASTEWIDRVILNSIDNTSGNNDGYAAFTEQGTLLTIGQDYALTLTPDYSGFNYPEYFTVWIDLDDDGAFEAPSELIFDAGEAVNGTLTGTLTVPTGSPFGPKRLRVVMKYNTAPADGCADGYDYGETEDYCVTLQGADAIGELSTVGVLAYPNPAVQQITFDLSGSTARGGVVEVLDNTGRILVRKPLRNGRALVNTSGMASGSYIYRIVPSEAQGLRGKFQVQHD